jgi:hypothetical protein
MPVGLTGSDYFERFGALVFVLVLFFIVVVAGRVLVRSQQGDKRERERLHSFAGAVAANTLGSLLAAAFIYLGAVLVGAIEEHSAWLVGASITVIGTTLLIVLIQYLAERGE